VSPRKRKLLLIVALSLTLLAGGAYLFRRQVVYAPIRATVERALEKKIAAGVEVKTLDGPLGREVRIEEASLEQVFELPAGSTFKVDELLAQYSLADLVTGDKRWIKGVEIVRPRLEVDLRRPIVPKPPTGKAPERPILPPIEIRGGTVDVTLKSGRRLVIEGIDGHVEPRGGDLYDVRIGTATLPYAITGTADLARFLEKRLSVLLTIADGASGRASAALDVPWKAPLDTTGRLDASRLDLAPLLGWFLGTPITGTAIPLDLALRLHERAVGASGGVSIGDLGALRPHLAGRLSAELHVQGPEVSLAATVSGLAVSGTAIPVQSATVKAFVSPEAVTVTQLVVWAPPASLVAEGRISLGDDPVVRGGGELRIPDVSAFLPGSRGDVSVRARIYELPLEAPRRARAAVNVYGRDLGYEGRTVPAVRLEADTHPGRIRIRDLSIATGTDPSAVRATAHVSLREDGGATLSLDSFAAVIRGKLVPQDLYAKAFIDPDGDAGAVIDSDRIDLGTLSAAIPRFPEIQGVASFAATLGGRAGERGGAFRVKADLGPGGALRAHGTVDASTREASILFEARRLDVAPFASRIPSAVRNLRGFVSGQILAQGKLPRPRLSGTVHLEEGEIAFSEELATLREIDMRAHLEGVRATIDRLTFAAGGGEGSVTGTVSLDPATLRPDRFQFKLAGRDMLLVGGRDARLRTDADLRLSGRPDNLSLAGQVHLRDFRWFRDFGVLQRRPKKIASAAGDSAVRSALHLDVQVSSEPELWVDNREALVRASARVHLRGTAAEPVVDGGIDILEGKTKIAYRAFRIDRGLVTFLDGRLDRPWVEVHARTRQTGVDVFVDVRGPGDNPSIKLSSNPPLDEADILSLLALGVTRSGAQGADAEKLAASAAAKYLLNEYFFERFRGRNRDIGIMDRLTVELDTGKQGASGSSSSTAGEVAGPRFTVILDITEKWGTQVERDRYGFYNFDLLYQWRFH
jgi:hypothetical protein